MSKPWVDDDPTQYVGHFDTTDIGGGAHQDMTKVTAVWDPAVYAAPSLHPEGVHSLEDVTEAPIEAVQVTDEAPTPPPVAKAPTKAVRRRQKAATEE